MSRGWAIEPRNDYPADWPEIARQVKDRAAWRCIRCGHPNETPTVRAHCDEFCRHHPDGKQRMLTVHHLNGDKADSRWWNLLALCQVCHLTIQARVMPDRPWLFDHSSWFVPYVCGFYASYYGGFEITLQEARADPERWLKLGQPWRKGA